MHQIEYLTIRNGWVILMGTTREVLILSFIDFISSDSLANGDEPDESDIPIYIHNHLLRERELQKDVG